MTTFAHTSHPDDSNWSEGFHFPGDIDGSSWAYSLGTYRGLLIIGGYLYQTKDITPRGIMAWDGDHYYALDTGISFSPNVMAEFNGRLAVAGHNSPVAIWDGTTWTTAYLGRQARLLCGYDTLLVAAVDKLAATDSLAFLTAWNGQSWLPLGSGFNGGITSMIAFDGKLIVSGNFTQISGQPAAHIASWDGSSWTRLGTGLIFGAVSLVLVDSQLVAVGYFDSVPGLDLATWTSGGTWTVRRSTFSPAIQSAHVVNDSIFVVTSHAQHSRTTRVAYWTGSDFALIADYDAGWAECATTFNNKLAIAGRFQSTPFVYDWIFALRENGQWRHPSGNGVGYASSMSVNGLTPFQGRLVATGLFEFAGDTPANNVAAWDGTQWHDIGIPNSAWTYSPVILGDLLYVIATMRNDQTGCDNRLYAWDGAYWSEVPSPPGCMMKNGRYQNQLVTYSSGRILRWTGSAWTEIAEGPPDIRWTAVYSMIELSDKLILVGSFDSVANIYTNGVAAWDGRNWSPLGAGLPETSYLTGFQFDGNLYVCGDFQDEAGLFAGGLARWDGRTWHPVGSGITHPWAAMINGAATFHGQLVIVGRFDSIDGVPARNIAMWNGRNWRALGSGVYGTDAWNSSTIDPSHFAVAAATYQSSLCVGGSFMYAGDKMSINFAQWNLDFDEIDSLIILPKPDDAAATPADFVLDQNYPNPFNLSTQITFSLPSTDRVSLVIYNALGQQVRSLVNETLPAGNHLVTWDGRSDMGAIASSGVYFCRIETTSQSTSRKMALVK